MWPTVAILTAGVIFFVLTSHGMLRRILGTRVLVSIGKRSYGLYLWHFVVLATIDARLGLTTWPLRLLGIAITAIVVPLSYRYIERPFLLRKARYEPRQLRPGGSLPSQMNGAAQPSPYNLSWAILVRKSVSRLMASGAWRLSPGTGRLR
jgi:peptidoglycan/LPS O-acetylase OafA/YrhL